MHSLPEIERVMELERDRIEAVCKKRLLRHIRVMVWNRCMSLPALILFSIQSSIEGVQREAV